ncbi:helix-turn-helix domain-containing protein [Trinickia terrae]|uniref:Helix-turn-helix domain-containing protein n=1 Tax=Trinickia terrae TaxID=2571161 RepID=A0A4U1I5Q3_9BURK|nr:helix-turn-helix domain-containing protein [Trinickia terrae]TKC88681.1 helix-turn-helix domain-containing protein [Trinickia terrae]
MDTALPCLVTRFETDDVDDLARGLTLFEQRFDQLSAGRFHGKFVEVSLGDVQVYCEHTNQSIHEAGRIRADACGFAIAAEVSGRAVFCGSPLAGGELMRLSEGDELDFRTARVMRTVGFVLPVARLAELGLDAPAAAAARTSVPGSRVVCADRAATVGLRLLIERMLETFAAYPADDAPGAQTLQAPQAALAVAALDELQSALVALSRRGRDSAAAARPVWIARRRVVDRAMAFIHAHAADPITIGALCKEISVSRRTLQYCFEDVLGVAPLAYLKAVRLNGARRALKSRQAPSLGVGDIAAQWGFWHPSHFREDYRRMFGELPSVTLRRHANNRVTRPPSSDAPS